MTTLRLNKPYFTITNLVLFQAGWFICVIAAAHDYQAVSVLSCAARR